MTSTPWKPLTGRPNLRLRRVVRHGLRGPDSGVAAQVPRHLDCTVEFRCLAELALCRRVTKTRCVQHQPAAGGRCATTDAKHQGNELLRSGGSYTFKESVTGRIGINNLTDEDPPLVGQSNCPSVYCNGNTFPQVYDTLGRYGFCQCDGRLLKNQPRVDSAAGQKPAAFFGRRTKARDRPEQRTARRVLQAR